MKALLGKITAASFLLLAAAAPASADIVFCGKKGQQQPAGMCTISDLLVLVYMVVNLLIGFAGLVAIIYIVWGGLILLLSAGDPGKIGDGKKTIRDALLGFILVMLSYLIVSYVAELIMPGVGDPIQAFKDFIPL
jgi:hypothetical protein